VSSTAYASPDSLPGQWSSEATPVSKRWPSPGPRALYQAISVWGSARAAG
jgi:hypothetical protein